MPSLVIIVELSQSAASDQSKVALGTADDA